MAAPMSCAPAQARLLCTSSSSTLTGLDWLMSLSWSTFLLVLAGYLTAGAVTLLPVLNTFVGVWRMHAVGGGTRGEPFVATSLCYACTLYMSLMSNPCHVDDSAWINGFGVFFYLVYLLMFLHYAHDAHGRTTRLVCIPVAVVYLSLTMGVGFVTESTEAVQWMCTLASLAANCIPLALAIFVMDRYVENLPDCWSSSVGLVYSLVWLGLGLVQGDYHAMGQNTVGAICSIAFLALLTRWPSNPAAPLRVPLIHHHVIDVPPPLANDPPAVLQGDHQQAPQAPQDANLPLVANNPLPALDDLGMVDPAVADAEVVVVNPPLVANPLPALVDLDMDDPAVVDPAVADAEVVGANPPLVANPLPALVDPDVLHPAVAVPEVVDPDIADPEVVPPAAAVPEVVDPDIADLEVVPPAAAAPEVVDPDIADPEVVPPAAVV